MRRKKILVINPISLFPKVMASQDRIFHMVKRLSCDHLVDLATPIRNENELQESMEKLAGVCNKFYPIPAVNPSENLLKRKFYGLGSLFYYYLFKYPGNFFYNSRKYYLSKFSEILSKNNYDIVQVEYWYMGKIFEKLGNVKLKVIDSHDILFDKREQEFKNRYGENLSSFKRKYLAKYKEFEISSLKLADLIIYITATDRNTLSNLSFANKNIIIATGQDVDFFKSHKTKPDAKMILFYGAMGGRPNIDAFFYFWNDILPLVKKEIPGVKVMVLGANPPNSLKKLHNGINMIVTGFVDDVRPYLARANFLVIPLNVAAGFRSRLVDVMAMGVPVIGTHKALDNIGMKNGIHGFVTDSKEEMAYYAVKLLKDSKLRNKMGEGCKKFVTEKYSIEATYGKLSQYYSDVDIV
jgi:glycosyltransferase involved in cell wall biosynthesis